MMIFSGPECAVLAEVRTGADAATLELVQPVCHPPIAHRCRETSPSVAESATPSRGASRIHKPPAKSHRLLHLDAAHRVHGLALLLPFRQGLAGCGGYTRIDPWFVRQTFLSGFADAGASACPLATAARSRKENMALP